MPYPIFLSFLFYIGTLAATQTVYGGRFMVLRWLTLLILTTVSALYWLFRGARLGTRSGSYGPIWILVYLGATLISVAAAENMMFSGLKWVTQAMLLLTCMIFLRGTSGLETTNQILLVLKLVTGGLLFLSILKPARMTILDTEYYRGAMGDPNSMGHIAAICALIYLHGAVIGQKKWWRTAQLIGATVAVGILLLSGARSSMLLFLTGVGLMNLYYGITRNLLRSFLVKSAIFISIALLLLFASRTLSALHSKAMDFVIKDIHHTEGLTVGKLVSTRERLWTDAWEGFKRRPILGWGFGANADITSDWSITITSSDMIRDVTNDILLTLEGSGLVGFLAYLGLIIAVIKQWPTREEIWRLRNSRRIGIRTRRRLLSAYCSILKKPMPREEIISQRGTEDEVGLESLQLPGDHEHAIMYILSVSGLFLFLSDCSAFSGGSIISAIFWMSAGTAGLLHSRGLVSRKGIIGNTFSRSVRAGDIRNSLDPRSGTLNS